MQGQVFDSLIMSVTRSPIGFNANGGGAESCSCDTRLTNSTCHPELVSGSYRLGITLPHSESIHSINRFRLGGKLRGRNDGVEYLPLLRGEGLGEVLTIVTQSLDHLVTLSDLQVSEVLVW